MYVNKTSDSDDIYIFFLRLFDIIKHPPPPPPQLILFLLFNNIKFCAFYSKYFPFPRVSVSKCLMVWCDHRRAQEFSMHSAPVAWKVSTFFLFFSTNTSTQGGLAWLVGSVYSTFGHSLCVLSMRKLVRRLWKEVLPIVEPLFWDCPTTAWKNLRLTIRGNISQVTPTHPTPPLPQSPPPSFPTVILVYCVLC